MKACEVGGQTRQMAHPRSITVVLGRFDDLLTRGLRELIEGERNLAILAAGVEHARLHVVLRAHRPDVVILDAARLRTLAEVRELSAEHPHTHLVLLVSDLSAEECAQLLAFGASACLARETQSRDVLSAIHLASRGLQVAPRVSSRGGGGGAMARGSLLTRREAEVLPLLQQGRSNAEIALAMQVSVETVRTHARNIYRKLGVSSRRELSAPAATATWHQTAPAPPAPSRRAVRLAGRPRRGYGLHK